MFTQTVSYSAAFIAGLLSFLSPCVLPLIPAYFSFITGFSIDELLDKQSRTIRKKVFLSTLAFVCGFSVVFILMGASASYLGSFIDAYKDYIRIIGALIIILLGIHMSGWIQIRGLNIDRRIHIQNRPLHFMGTFIIGMAFGAGWSPCIGPLLGSILVIASSEETIWQGVQLLTLYSAGMAIPFILISIFINFLLVFLQRANRIIKYVNRTAGILLILVGIFLLTDSFALIYSLLSSH
ncbi:MAG: cytochrome c biogenesis protein CcdA [Desulfobacterales bacterium]|jgi:cytochrome c-type biogenesis protein|nr:cytochrome c biogenesis protein CcdA [Desulfobacterales bacterium]